MRFRREGKKEEEMYDYMVFDPYLITYLTEERNQQIFREVQALRLKKQVRRNHKVRGSRLVAFNLGLTAVSKNLDPHGIIRKHESVLGRPQTEDSRRRETRRLQARGRQPVRGEPLLGQALHQDGARGRLAGSEEASGQTY